MLTLTQIIILAVIQGMAELLPISSSAHVIAAARLMHIKDTSSPQFSIMLVDASHRDHVRGDRLFLERMAKGLFRLQGRLRRFATKIIIATGNHRNDRLAAYQGDRDDISTPASRCWSAQRISEIGSKKPPTPSTPIMRLAMPNNPAKPLFNVGDTLALQGSKGGNELGAMNVSVTAKSTLQDLMNLYAHEFDLDPKAPAAAKGSPVGVALKPADDNPAAVRIQIVGNAGRDNRLKLKNGGLLNQDGQSPLIFRRRGKGGGRIAFQTAGTAGDRTGGCRR